MSNKLEKYFKSIAWSELSFKIFMLTCVGWLMAEHITEKVNQPTNEMVYLTTDGVNAVLVPMSAINQPPPPSFRDKVAQMRPKPTSGDKLHGGDYSVLTEDEYEQGFRVH